MGDLTCVKVLKKPNSHDSTIYNWLGLQNQRKKYHVLLVVQSVSEGLEASVPGKY
jgi:hypothetical protein